MTKHEERLKILREVAAEQGIKIEIQDKEDPTPVGAEPGVWDMLETSRAVWDKDGNLKNTPRPRADKKNLAIVLENDSQYSGKMSYHYHSDKIYWDGKLVEKHHWTQIAIDLEERYRLETTEADLRNGVFRVAYLNQIDPIKEYLSGLEWDGVSRIQYFAEHILKCECDDFTRPIIEIMSKKMFIAWVARALNPGCQMDTMPIFAGPKGVGKSRCVEFLLPTEQWYSRSKLNIGNKSALELIHQTGVWIWEFQELDDFHGKHSGTIKAFLTDNKDRYRVVYDKDPVFRLRTTCFYGTSNDRNIMDDGPERRFWVFWCPNKVDLQWIKENRDHLWAEAVATYHTGHEWHLLPHEEDLLEKYQEAFLVEDPWAYGVLDCLVQKGGATIAEIMEYLQVPVSHRHSGNSRRVAKICKENGCSFVRRDNKRVWTRN